MMARPIKEMTLAADEATQADSEDIFLRILVDVVNQNVGQFDVTLTVGGLLVTGIIVSGKDYFAGIADEIRSSTNDGSNTLADVFQRVGSDIYQSSDEAQEDGGPLPAFIHLRDAHFVSPGERPIPANRGVYWRGRLSAVDGFCFGTMSSAE